MTDLSRMTLSELAAYCVHMAYEGMRGRRCIPAWRALPPRERLIFFGSVGGRSTT